MDRLTPLQRKKNMKAVKNKGSKIELILGKTLWTAGLRYRKNLTTIFGKPDFVIKKHKIAIFADSEFWHGKNWKTAKKEIKSNKDFWYQKISANINRDKIVTETLKKDGWTVFRFWGKEILNDSDSCLKKIMDYLEHERKI